MKGAKETKKINKVNRFQCTYQNCRRILNSKGTKSFPCTMCGHGMMKLTKPRAFCDSCEKPVYENIDLRPDSISKEGYFLICGNCTMKKVGYIAGLEKQLNTEFFDTEDMEEKLAYYNAKKEEVGEENIPNTTIRVRNLGSRLRAIRKKLNLSQTEFAEYTKLTRQSIISYEKSGRQIPKDIKEWTKSAESTFKHLGIEKGRVRIMEVFNGINETSQKEAVTC